MAKYRSYSPRARKAPGRRGKARGWGTDYLEQWVHFLIHVYVQYPCHYDFPITVPKPTHFNKCPSFLPPSNIFISMSVTEATFYLGLFFFFKTVNPGTYRQHSGQGDVDMRLGGALPLLGIGVATLAHVCMPLSLPSLSLSICPLGVPSGWF